MQIMHEIKLRSTFKATLKIADDVLGLGSVNVYQSNKDGDTFYKDIFIFSIYGRVFSTDKNKIIFIGT